MRVSADAVAESMTVAGPLRPCPICGVSETRGLAPAPALATCAACGLLYRRAESANCEGQYWTSYTDNGPEQRFDAARAAFYDNYWRRVSRLPQRPRGSARLLDVGCVPGHALRPAIRDGWTAEGVEISAELSEATREATGARVWTGFVEDIDFGAERYDLILFNDVVRAVRKPVTALHKCAEILEPGGAVVIKEINCANPHHAQRISQPYPFDMQFLTPTSAERLLEEAGFAKQVILNAPISLMTNLRIRTVSQRWPGLYRFGLRAVNTGLRWLDPSASALKRPLGRSFLAVGFVSGARGD